MQYFPKKESENIFSRCCAKAGLQDSNRISIDALARLVGEVEKSLAGSFGSAAASSLLRVDLIYERGN